MPRVHFVRSAQKDYPDYGIKKGDTYYHWTPFRQRKRMSLTLPKPSQVESNGTRSSYLAIQESLEIDIEQATSLEDLDGILSSAAEEIRSVAEELNEKAQNIEEGFGHSTELSEQFAEQAGEVEQWADLLKDAVLDDYDSPLDEPVEPVANEYENKDTYESDMVQYNYDKIAYDQALEKSVDELENSKQDVISVIGDAPDI